jgi:hypothetical protein
VGQVPASSLGITGNQEKAGSCPSKMLALYEADRNGDRVCVSEMSLSSAFTFLYSKNAVYLSS